MAHGSIVHRLGSHRQDGGEREDDTDEKRPQYAVHVRGPPEETVAHVEWPGHKLDLGVIPVPSAAEDRDDVRQVERHSGHREDGIQCDVADELEQPGKDADERHKPDRAQGRLRPGADVAEVTLIRETYKVLFDIALSHACGWRRTLVTAEGIHGAGRSLERGLADEERRQAYEGLQRC